MSSHPHGHPIDFINPDSHLLGKKEEEEAPKKKEKNPRREKEEEEEEEEEPALSFYSSYFKFLFFFGGPAIRVSCFDHPLLHKIKKKKKKIRSEAHTQAVLVELRSVDEDLAADPVRRSF